MIEIVQLFALIFGVFAISRTLLRAKDQKISVSELIFWLAVWSTLLGVVFFPVIVSEIALFLGIGRGTDVILYVSIGVLFYLVFRLYVKLEESQRQITLLVREISLKEKKK